MGAAVIRQALGPPLERARERQVQLGALAGQQVVDDDLAQERVPEQVEALLVGDDELRRDRLAQRLAQHPRIDAGCVGQDLVIEPPSGREQPQQLLRVLRQPLDPQHQRVAQRRRQRAAPVHPGRQQLLGEQRVALRAREQPVEQILARLGAEDVGELLGQLVARQPVQLDAAGARVALELGEQRPQRMAAVQLVRAVGGDDQHALAAQRRGEIDEERARRAVGPVQVLDRHQQAVLAGQKLQQLQQRVEQARLRGRLVVGLAVAAAEPGEDLGERVARGAGEQRRERGIAGAGQRAQRADDRRVGQLALAQLDAVAADHADAVGARRALELAQQPRLADAGLAGHERERRPARPRPRRPPSAAPRARRSGRRSGCWSGGRP